MAGMPQERLAFGNTEIPEDMWADFLRGLEDRFNPASYHLLNNNCNSFTQEALQFLTGQDLPAKIRILPLEFASTYVILLLLLLCLGFGMMCSPTR